MGDRLAAIASLDIGSMLARVLTLRVTTGARALEQRSRSSLALRRSRMLSSTRALCGVQPRAVGSFTLRCSRSGPILLAVRRAHLAAFGLRRSPRCRPALDACLRLRGRASLASDHLAMLGSRSRLLRPCDLRFHARVPVVARRRSVLASSAALRQPRLRSRAVTSRRGLLSRFPLTLPCSDPRSHPSPPRSARTARLRLQTVHAERRYAASACARGLPSVAREEVVLAFRSPRRPACARVLERVAALEPVLAACPAAMGLDCARFLARVAASGLAHALRTHSPRRSLDCALAGVSADESALDARREPQWSPRLAARRSRCREQLDARREPTVAGPALTSPPALPPAARCSPDLPPRPAIAHFIARVAADQSMLARRSLGRDRSAPASSLTSPCSTRPSPSITRGARCPAALALPTTSPCSDPRSLPRISGCSGVPASSSTSRRPTRRSRAIHLAARISVRASTSGSARDAQLDPAAPPAFRPASPRSRAESSRGAQLRARSPSPCGARGCSYGSARGCSARARVVDRPFSVDSALAIGSPSASGRALLRCLPCGRHVRAHCLAARTLLVRLATSELRARRLAASAPSLAFRRSRSLSLRIQQRPRAISSRDDPARVLVPVALSTVELSPARRAGRRSLA